MGAKDWRNRRETDRRRKGRVRRATLTSLAATTDAGTQFLTPSTPTTFQLTSKTPNTTDRLEWDEARKSSVHRGVYHQVLADMHNPQAVSKRDLPLALFSFMETTGTFHQSPLMFTACLTCHIDARLGHEALKVPQSKAPSP
ncbi:hypothetical protein AB1N83_011236 [Pleurotus pulmonarius]